MKVAMIGLGKLGLPVACAMVRKGHGVFGYDIDKSKSERYRKGVCDLYEPDIETLLTDALENGFSIVESLEEAVNPADIIFIAVPTPSQTTGAFDVAAVIEVITTIAGIMKNCDNYKVVAIISTVLPMTTRRDFLPALKNVLGLPGDRYGLCYNAQFIAMGSVVENMLYPEFVLVGEYDTRSGDLLERFYSQLTHAPILRMTLENAEIVKVIYNTFIGMKIIYGNTIMELCDAVPHADCDVVHDAVTYATDRLISSRYMRGGMGDGGGCHPRDNRALSWLAREISLSADPFKFVMDARDGQTRYLAQVIGAEHKKRNLPVAVLGLTFKPNTDVVDESPSLLLIDFLKRDFGIRPRSFDPIIKNDPLPREPHLYVIATAHEELKGFPYEPGSAIIDVWRMLDVIPEGCSVRQMGVAQQVMMESPTAD